MTTNPLQHRPARAQIVLGDSSLASYPEGGGHWSVYLQYMLGLRALGYDVLLLELLKSSGNRSSDEAVAQVFFERLQRYDLHDQAIVLAMPSLDPEQHVEKAQVYGRHANSIQERLRNADLLWNICAAVRPPLLGLPKRSALVDLDPGYLQISSSLYDMRLTEHDVFLTLGHRLGNGEQYGPDLGVKWHTFSPFVFMPFWADTPDPGESAPFTSVTQWTWSSIPWKGNVLSTSKRDAYLRYVDLPRHVPARMEIAANIDEDDRTGDRELLLKHGWKLVHPHTVASTPERYRAYIQSSRAEFLCPKPVFRELQTGWVSDRSLGYLASGRPVLAEETGFSEFVPTGTGLLSFRTLDEAAAGVRDVLERYPVHSAAARELVESHFDSSRCLEEMVAACS